METPPIDVLRYWLLCIRYEEALAARPRARRADTARREIDLRNPVSEREYFKLSAAHVAELLQPECPEIEVPIDDESAEFFEARLARQYRFGEGDTDVPELLVMFPAVHLRRNLLTGLIRFEAALTFVNRDGNRFEAPSRTARRRGALPPPPVRMRIRRVPPEEGPPLFADARLLAYELGALPEEMDQLFDTWHRLADAKAPIGAYLQAAARTLNGKAADKRLTALLQCIADAAETRAQAVGTGARCYPLGLLVDAGKMHATIHLQREIEALIRERVPLKEASPLLGFLRCAPLDEGERPLLGLMSNKNITVSQRTVAEHAEGSILTAAEGPPGTGKTTLILHLAAHRLTKRIAAYIETGRMPDDITLICSTNNRAVDNAVDPLMFVEEESRLAWAVRAGNRRVCETRLTESLKQAAVYITSLAAEDDSEILKTRLKKAERRFKLTYDMLSQMLGPRIERAEALAKKQRLQSDIIRLTRRIEERYGKTALESLPNAAAVHAAMEALERLEADLYTLSTKCERRASKRTVHQAERHYENVTARLVKKCEKAEARLGRTCRLFVVPDITARQPIEVLSAWEDAAEDAIEATAARLEELNALSARLEAAGTLHRLTVALAEIAVPNAQPIDEARADILRRAATEAAEAVREAHVAVHADEYLGTLRAVLDRLANTASLRRLKPEIRSRLQELFPVWGCTLLSLGNIFEDLPECIDTVIVDEAGQCHPAYGVSALFRARQALVLGDVHQLTPVFGLTELEERPLLRNALFCRDPRPKSELLRVHDRSFSSLQRLTEAGVQTPLRLTDHFRCQPEIIEISDRLCHYGLTVHTPRRSKQETVPFLKAPVLFMHVEGEAERDGGSRHNAAEREALCRVLDALLRYGLFPDEIAVITPYRSQLLHLRRALSARGLPIEHSAELLEIETETGTSDTEGIAVGTVHRFQGGERSVVLFSTVITETRGSDLLNNRVNLINTAVSRAMDHLIVIGRKPTLAEGRLTRLLLQATPLSQEEI